MNDFISAFILAVIQGITEWIPVSSSGHIELVSMIIGYPSSLLFDVALHFGTLMAVFVYYGKDISDILKDVLTLNFKSPNGRMGLLLVIATIPATIAGYFMKGFFEKSFGNLGTLALGFGVTSLFLFIASLDWGSKKKELSYKDSLIIGCAQVISILPGISRSGATITTGILRGLKTEDAVKFSFLMSIPVIFGANILVVGTQKLPSELLWASLVSFVTGLLTLHVLVKHVLTTQKNLRWFAAYAMILAAAIGAYYFIY